MGRTVRRLTTQGEINQEPSYHTRTTFSGDGEYLVISSFRDGCSMLCRVRTSTGQIVQLTDPFESDKLVLNPGTLASDERLAVLLA